ncbi:tetraspanin-11 isoform X1 [Lutra lutra]|uniref:tetraspanin-11 isoform X1 n=1 Tax=Lutra lutra TaxID=9657 RepID=UPI001FD08A30|nr:tetraspanin-11 isoform X1 [Lutra lutra]XP_047598105.1 tetraspanin-11 isoform X1 [Lutra lutra]XP_047598106.1 tetraspanin-11 isoform X1 [Lutra lutra]
MAHYKAEQDDWLIVYLKYLLFVFNFFFWVGGAAVMAVGVWTLVEKSGYLSVLASSTFAASAYILIFAGALVMVTGFLGFGAVIREDRSCLSTYFCLLLVIFLVELVAGVLAHLYYQRLSDELKQHLARTLAENYRQPGAADITTSVDRLQQDFKCCGSNSSADWQHSTYILSREAEGRQVPDSCCKTVVARCGQRAHPSNIYKVEGGCITKLEQFLADHLLLMGAVGIGVACLQLLPAPPPPHPSREFHGKQSRGCSSSWRAEPALVRLLPDHRAARPRPPVCPGDLAAASPSGLYPLEGGTRQPGTGYSISGPQVLICKMGLIIPSLVRGLAIYM